ncbi:MAG: sulfite exporter TauE/SafE family protein [Myxococcaceae bacterium]
MNELLLSSFTVGLLGSLHCAVAVACGKTSHAGGRLVAFVAGKLGTYAVLGLSAATVGSAFGSPRLGPRGFAVLALVAGATMAFLGARTLWRRLVPPARPGAPGPLATLLAAALRAPGGAAPFLAGVLAGLLPCGLVWAMVAHSLTAGPAPAGALVMVAFGLGTTPSLLAAGWVSRLATVRTRRLGEVAAATAVMLMGLMGLWRGASALLLPAGCPGCHPGA